MTVCAWPFSSRYVLARLGRPIGAVTGFCCRPRGAALYMGKARQHQDDNIFNIGTQYDTHHSFKLAAAVAQQQSTLRQHAAAGLMHEKEWVKLVFFVVLVFVFCRVFVAENLGVLLGGAAVVGLGIYAALLAEIPQLGSGEETE